MYNITCSYTGVFYCLSLFQKKRKDKVDDTHKINNMPVKPLAWKHATVKYLNNENAYCMF